MSTEAFRTGAKPFYDNAKFPRGFNRSGDFTISESDILTQYGEMMLSLETGKVAPESDAEKQFVAVCQNAKEPETKLEKAWVKYVEKSRGKRRFHTLTGSKKLNAAAEESDGDDDIDLSDSDVLGGDDDF